MKKLLTKLINNKILVWVISIAFWTFVWYVAAVVVNNELMIPRPINVIKRLIELVVTAKYWQSIGRSLLNVLVGFAIGNVLGLLFGFLASIHNSIKVFLTPLMTVIKSTPVASFIILILIALGKEYTPSFTSFLMVLPVVFMNISESMQGANVKLLEMAEVFDLSQKKKLRYIYIPAVKNGYRAAVKTGMGLSWKAGVAAEVLVSTRLTLGGAIYDSKVYLEITDLFAWTLTVIVISLIIEIIAVRILTGKK